ncbi:hypothetical protein HF888_10915 [Bermanella marisrubri]|uniref:Uncharacterized protein n=1 Tax=Bermanella marisrubri TaxID=207949 RepID=Q1N5J8_9GAMM|nr:hypothetical protein [Bermanella marisrubri]EAT13944.1 hypothetical protein RED65_11139 [Oceanobacter sp. RED65] [Bermanella marisrubri]QIZ84695.1 hypothetical protein HF888_10915 [Bermanella marisrubri]
MKILSRIFLGLLFTLLALTATWLGFWIFNTIYEIFHIQYTVIAIALLCLVTVLVIFSTRFLKRYRNEVWSKRKVSVVSNAFRTVTILIMIGFSINLFMNGGRYILNIATHLENPHVQNYEFSYNGCEAFHENIYYEIVVRVLQDKAENDEFTEVMKSWLPMLGVCRYFDDPRRPNSKVLVGLIGEASETEPEPNASMSLFADRTKVLIKIYKYLLHALFVYRPPIAIFNDVQLSNDSYTERKRKLMTPPPPPPRGWKP